MKEKLKAWWKGLFKAEDLKPVKFPEVVWGNGKDAESLQKLRDDAVRHAEDATNWYLREKRSKRCWGRFLRLMAMLATFAAGVIPILVGIGDENGEADFDPAWASVALAAAAALVGLDYFFGFSNAWIRFIETEMKISRERKAFEWDWAILRAGWGGAQPTPEQVLTALDRLKAAVLRVHELVEAETSVWIAEFRSALKTVDEAARAKLEAEPKLPGANVTVTNGDQAKNGWTLRVGDGAPARHSGQRAACTGLLPGPRRFAAEGEINGVMMRDEVTVVVPPSGVAEVTLTLR